MTGNTFARETCAYCGNARTKENQTDDHVFARKFLLEPRRDGLPQVPACQKPCNTEKSGLENELMNVLGFGGRHGDAGENLAELDWRRLDERVENLSSEIEAIARHDSGCDRLMSVPGIGPIISSAVVAAIGSGDVFSKGRDFAAWLGLVPKQISTGDRTILGKNTGDPNGPIEACPLRRSTAR